MSLMNLFDVAGSAMAAQTIQLANTTASNIANAQSVAENPEETYRARHPVFATALSDFQRGLASSEDPDGAWSRCAWYRGKRCTPATTLWNRAIQPQMIRAMSPIRM